MTTWAPPATLRELPESPLYIDDVKGRRFVRQFQGPYADCVRFAPAKLQAMEDLPEGYYIAARTARAGDGEAGTLTITLRPAPQHRRPNWN